ncbi:MAG: glycosyltransferase family 2 protein [Thermoleophilia bacterium]
MPELSVVICSLNGAPGVARALRSLHGQLPPGALEAVVVDDGSTDDTAAVAAEGGAVVVRHPVNRGLAAARNSGVAAATAPVVAFIDDDCEARPGWARGILAGYDAPDVAGVGGPVHVGGGDGFVLGYLRRHNPLQQLEMELARGDAPALRLWLYLRRQWTEPVRPDRREVFALVGASMSFRREVLEETGGFDERFRFGAEELELCHRVRRLPGARRLVVDGGAAVTHHFAPSLGDTLRRSRSYGRGAARFRAAWPSVSPTVFPAPLVAAGLALLAVRRPWARVAAVIAPQLMLPSGLRAAVRERNPAALLDAYVELMQEAASDWGFARGWWEFRDLEPAVDAAPAAPVAEAVR